MLEPFEHPAGFCDEALAEGTFDPELWHHVTSRDGLICCCLPRTWCCVTLRDDNGWSCTPADDPDGVTLRVAIAVGTDAEGHDLLLEPEVHAHLLDVADVPGDRPGRRTLGIALRGATIERWGFSIASQTVDVTLRAPSSRYWAHAPVVAAVVSSITLPSRATDDAAATG